MCEHRHQRKLVIEGRIQERIYCAVIKHLNEDWRVVKNNKKMRLSNDFSIKKGFSSSKKTFHKIKKIMTASDQLCIIDLFLIFHSPPLPPKKYKQQSPQQVDFSLQPSPMNKCFACKNARRQLLMLKCSHDVCIKCAADNYFVNCKNKLNPKKSRQINYFCEKCLEQTELQPKTIQLLKKYFMENIEVDEKQKTIRRERLVQRQQADKHCYQKLNRLDNQNSNRPKSLEIQIAERKRSLSKYLNQQQVEKFMTMQQEYQPSAREATNKHHQFTLGSGQKMTPQTHRQTDHVNEYELNRGPFDEKKKVHSNKYLKDQQYDQKQTKKHLNRVRSQQYQQKGRQRDTLNTERSSLLYAKDMEYELYHNGKGVPDYNPTNADYLLRSREHQSGRYDSKSKYSSGSQTPVGGKPVGMIRIRRSPQPQNLVVPRETMPYNNNLQTTGREDRLNSWRSQQNLSSRGQNYCNKTQADYHHVRNASSSAEWQIQSKSTKRAEEKTVPHGRSSQNMDKILETLQNSQKSHKKLSKIREKQSYDENSRSTPESPKLQIYMCKIHQQQEIIYFCLRCNQLICSQCALRGSHKQHEIYSLKKSGQLLRQNLTNKINTLSKMMLEEESKEKIYGQCIAEVNLESGRQREKIKTAFQSFIFSVDKKYKELLKEIEDKYALATGEYVEKLNQSRNNYVQYSRVKDDLSQTLEECRLDNSRDREGEMMPASNQLGNFHVKTHKNKHNINYGGVQAIHKLILKINSVAQFLKTSSLELLSNKKGSLLSERSSLRLSDSSNLLDEDMSALNTPTTNTPQLRQSSPKRHSKRKVIVGAVCLNVNSWVRLVQCGNVVEGLKEMQDIVKAVKLESREYSIKALN